MAGPTWDDLGTMAMFVGMLCLPWIIGGALMVVSTVMHIVADVVTGRWL